MKSCTVIYNPQSGKKMNINIEKIKEKLIQRGYDTTIIPTTKKGDATEITKNIDYTDLLICVGGDGTLNEVVKGNLQRDKKLLIASLPKGTSNDVGMMYGYTANLDKNIDLLLKGKIKNVDICLINNVPFVYVACMGSYTNVPYKTPRELKEKYGKIGYAIYAFKEIKNKVQLFDVKYKVNGIEYEGTYSFVFITNTSRVAGVNNIYNDVKLDDNKFEVVLCSEKTKKDLLKTLYLFKTKDISTISGIQYYKTDKFSIEFKEVPKFSWCIDGEELKHEDKIFEFSIDKSMNMLVPNVNISKLFEKEDINS